MGRMVAGVSEALWNDKKACGRKYRVRCIGGANKAPHPCHNGKSVVVTVVDFCQPPCNGILNLSQDAFDVIADRDAGKVRVEYNHDNTRFAARRIYEDLMATGYIDLTKLLKIHQEHERQSSDLSFIAWNSTLDCQRQGTWLQNNYELDEAGGRTGQRDDPIEN
ncbi:hypothetical protein Dsin_013874 [Dipteronia sinensis]|uniref:Expansin-like EG45 domain-containing protein n=1 Tax=Dipteronia sinensis TaxID=43782 RepID=A0AAE0AM10_9ROSI|nr:hypothetical protein Dsin_013874 [Dipteronia sinensis]